MAIAGSTASLGELLIKEGAITAKQLSQALQAQKATSQSLGRVLVELGAITEATRTAVLHKSLGFELIQLKNLKIEPAVLSLIPPAFATKHKVLPIRQEGGNSLAIAMEDPSDLMVIDAIKNQTRLNIKAYLTTSEDLNEALKKFYSAAAAQVQEAGLSRPHGRLYAIVRYFAFPFLCFAPLMVFMVLLLFNSGFQKLLTYKTTKFDIGLYTMLGWGLWSIVIWELNGIIFKPDEKE